MFKKKPDVSYLRVFGCLAYIHIPKDQRKDKLTPKAKEMMFLGYESGTKGYHFLHSNKSIYVATTVTFVENHFPNCSEKKLRNKISIPEPLHPQDDNTNQLPPDDLNLPPHDPPQQPDDGHNEDDDERGSTKPQSPHQQSPKLEEVDDNDAQIPQGEPHFNIGRPPIPQEYSPPPYDMPHERHFHTNPPRVRNPPSQPDNVYGQRHPVDIEREIQREREWTRQVLKGGIPNIVLEPVPEQDEPMGPPLTPPPPTPQPNDIEDLYAPAMDIDQMMQLGHHYILNQIMKQAAKPKEGIPYHYKDILKYIPEEQEKWKKACEEEIKSITNRNVWTLVDCPPDQKPVKCHWVFAKKSDGRYKAHLVAKGLSQIYGEDYNETFSLVTHFETVQLLLAYVC